MEFDLVIENGLVVLEQEIVHKNIGISHGKIAAIFDSEKWSAKEVFDASECYVMPGAIDTHTHQELITEKIFFMVPKLLPAADLPVLWKCPTVILPLLQKNTFY